MVSDKNNVNLGSYPGPVHTRKTSPYRKNIQRQSSVKCFCKTANPKHMKRFRVSEALPDVSKRGPTNIVHCSIVPYPPVNLCVYNPSVATAHQRTKTLNYAHKSCHLRYLTFKKGYGNNKRSFKLPAYKNDAELLKEFGK